MAWNIKNSGSCKNVSINIYVPKWGIMCLANVLNLNLLLYPKLISIVIKKSILHLLVLDWSKEDVKGYKLDF